MNWEINKENLTQKLLLFTFYKIGDIAGINWGNSYEMLTFT